MQPYIVQILFRIEDASYSADRYELECRLVLAVDAHQALQDARRLGLDGEATLTESSGRLIRRALVGVKNVRETRLEHGAVLFSELQELEPLSFPHRNESPSAAKVYLS